MNRLLQSGAGGLILALGLSGCATPYPPSPGKSVKQIARAPVVDRSARPQPAYPAAPTQPVYPDDSQVQVGQLPREDVLTPREYAPSYPGTAYPAEQYPAASAPYPGSAAPSAPTYPPAQGAYPAAPAYPPGGAYPPQSPDPADAYPPATPGGGYEISPAADLPLGVPEGARRPPAPRRAPEPEDDQIALAPPLETPVPPAAPADSAVPETPVPAPVAPVPAAPPPRPAPLPPAEITREGNQAVVALLDSADKYVKSGDLDKAGAALERALRIEPRNAGIWHDLAQIRLHQNQYQQAESLASKSNNLASGNRALQARNWKLIAVARKAGGNAAGAEEAEGQAALLSR